jgi:hypothetical protein
VFETKKVYLIAALDFYEYIHIPLALFPEWIRNNKIWTLTQEMVCIFGDTEWIRNNKIWTLTQEMVCIFGETTCGLGPSSVYFGQ